MKKKLLSASLLFMTTCTVIGLAVNSKNAMGAFWKPKGGGVDYVMIIDEATDNPTHKTGAVGTFLKTTTSGNQISFPTNQWVSYAPNGWGSIFENGAHWDANLYNSTPITGIKKIELQLWLNIFNGAIVDDAPYVNLSTCATSGFTDGVTKQRLSKGEGQAAGLGEIFVVETPDLPSHLKIDFGDNANNTFTTSIVKIKITYSCAAPTQKYIHHVNNINNVFNATMLDGAGFSNFQSSYYYLGKYSDAAIISTTLTLIDHNARAWSGITLTNGSPNGGITPSDAPRNFHAYNVGLSTTGLFSFINKDGATGSTLRDTGSVYPATTVAATGELTIVLLNDTLYFYIDNVFNTQKALSENFMGGFAAGQQYMLGLYWSNYFNASRTSTLTKEIYGATDVQAEIAANDVFANLR